MFCRVIQRSNGGHYEVITRWNGVIQRLRPRVILELIREWKTLLVMVLSLLYMCNMYCKGVYSEIKNTKSARCSNEWSNIDLVTNLFSSLESLLEAIFCPLKSSP